MVHKLDHIINGHCHDHIIIIITVIFIIIIIIIISSKQAAD